MASIKAVFISSIRGLQRQKEPFFHTLRLITTMTSILDQQVKLFQFLGKKYEWKPIAGLTSSPSPIPTTITKRRGTQSTRKNMVMPPSILFSDDSDDFEEIYPEKRKSNIPPPTLELFDDSINDEMNSPLCTEILSAAQKSRRTRRSLADMKSFSRNRTQMANEMYQKYNSTIFKSQLPENLPIGWNKNLNTTAGRAFRDASKGIELSTKVIDTPVRLRDTLLHEMCHIAVYTLPTVFANRNAKPHGPEFWHWAHTVNRTIPDAVNDRCHSYVIFKPFQFRCSNKSCNQLFERHSKCKSRIEFVGAVNRDGTVSLFVLSMMSNVNVVYTLLKRISHSFVVNTDVSLYVL